MGLIFFKDKISSRPPFTVFLTFIFLFSFINSNMSLLWISKSKKMAFDAIIVMMWWMLSLMGVFEFSWFRRQKDDE